MNLLLINEMDVETLLKGLQFTIITPTEPFFWGFVRDNMCPPLLITLDALKT
jgi:hypothetical protein